MNGKIKRCQFCEAILGKTQVHCFKHPHVGPFCGLNCMVLFHATQYGNALRYNARCNVWEPENEFHEYAIIPYENGHVFQGMTQPARGNNIEPVHSSTCT